MQRQYNDDGDDDVDVDDDDDSVFVLERGVKMTGKEKRCGSFVTVQKCCPYRREFIMFVGRKVGVIVFTYAISTVFLCNFIISLCFFAFFGC